ncbi:hypothetical protein [Methylocapsa aurea]|uniref:hypothetical protein n=1 Tax=Methylocapsa aurea TaxID=663610 RepID=UPI003D18CBD0
MIRKKAGDELGGWIDLANAGLLASFANGSDLSSPRAGGRRPDLNFPLDKFDDHHHLSIIMMIVINKCCDRDEP